MDVDALISPLSDEEGEKAGPDLGYSDARAGIEAPFQLDANGGEVDDRDVQGVVHRQPRGEPGAVPEVFGRLVPTSAAAARQHCGDEEHRGDRPHDRRRDAQSGELEWQ